jgi:hypothetical protein
VIAHGSEFKPQNCQEEEGGGGGGGEMNLLSSIIITPALRRLRQEGLEFKASLGYISENISKYRKF